ncbi:ABC transporter ATP-binding protein [Thermodesulfobacteriota bacterium]
MPILRIESLSKSFGGSAAVNNVSFTVDEGTILGLIGPNGSGKTTSFNLITGFLKPDRGAIIFNGKSITGFAPYRVCRTGIARTFQLSKPFASMTVLENVVAGRLFGGNEPVRTIKQAETESREILALTRLEKKRLTKVKALGMVDRKRVEVARALGTKPKLLLLDEMMAGLNSKEIEDAMQMVEEIKDTGVTVIMVEHVMKAVLGISDSVMVLSAGIKIAEGTPREIMNNERVIEAYLGDEHDS